MNCDLCEGDPGPSGLAMSGIPDFSVGGVLWPLIIESAPVAVREVAGRPGRLDSPVFEASPELFAFSLPFFEAALASG